MWGIIIERKEIQPLCFGPSGTNMQHFLPCVSIRKTSAVFPILFSVFLPQKKWSSNLISRNNMLDFGMARSVMKVLFSQSNESKLVGTEKDLCAPTFVSQYLSIFGFLSKEKGQILCAPLYKTLVLLWKMPFWKLKCLFEVRSERGEKGKGKIPFKKKSGWCWWRINVCDHCVRVWVNVVFVCLPNKKDFGVFAWRKTLVKLFSVTVKRRERREHFLSLKTPSWFYLNNGHVLLGFKIM